MTELSVLDEFFLKGIKNVWGLGIPIRRVCDSLWSSKSTQVMMPKKNAVRVSANSAFSSNALSLSAAVCSNKAKEHAGRNKIEIGLNIWTKSQRKSTQSYQHSSNYLLLRSAETSKQV